MALSVPPLPQAQARLGTSPDVVRAGLFSLKKYHFYVLIEHCRTFRNHNLGGTLSIPFKPRGSEARHGLKQLKEGFDDPSIDPVERLVEWAALHGSSQAIKAYSGEFLHQLALRCERRGDRQRAERLYDLSEQRLDGNPLGLARTLRDYGLFLVTQGNEPKVGLEKIEQALVLHAQDVDNAKGRRQHLITQSKLWRAHVLLGDVEAASSLDNLVELALGPDFNFHVRDRKIIVDFLIPRSKGKARRRLLAHQAVIRAERRQPARVIESYLKLLIDIELSIAGTVLRRIFRRE